MENKEKMVKIAGEEISEELLRKIQQDAIEKDKKEMANNWMKKEYQCAVCKISPRPGTKTVKKCTFCTKIFCDGCMFHQCPTKGKIITNSSVNISLTITLDVDKYMSYSCKNIKFGCEEMLANEARLAQHEKNCDFQVCTTYNDCIIQIVPGCCWPVVDPLVNNLKILLQLGTIFIYWQIFWHVLPT